MIRAAALAAVLVVLGGCEEYRNTTKHQVEDYKTCKDAGMDAYLNGVAEVMCRPPSAQVNP